MVGPTGGQRSFLYPGQVKRLTSRINTHFHKFGNLIMSESGFKVWGVKIKKARETFSRFDTSSRKHLFAVLSLK